MCTNIAEALRSPVAETVFVLLTAFQTDLDIELSIPPTPRKVLHVVLLFCKSYLAGTWSSRIFFFFFLGKINSAICDWNICKKSSGWNLVTNPCPTLQH